MRTFFYTHSTPSNNCIKITFLIYSLVFFIACQSEQHIDRSAFSYLFGEEDISVEEGDIDHAGLISNFNEESIKRGARIYNSNCIDCHGNPEVEGSIPLSTKFWSQSLKNGSDAFSMYQTMTRGYGSMPPQMILTPQQKYDVIQYIQEEYLEENPQVKLINHTNAYLASLPKGNSMGPETKPYTPWSDMDYGNFLMNTYELVDEENGIERFHSPGPSPFPDEDYSQNNFAYKGIAVRLDSGEGGVSKGKAWMMFDHDLMRVAGAWTGDGFIDWDAILLNDRHETYPRTIGKLHFETPVGPAWANPKNGRFDDPRFRARDGRAFGPLPKYWADYKGLYHHNEHIIISYQVGDAKVLEEFGLIQSDGRVVFVRTINIKASNSVLRMKVAPLSSQVEIKGSGAELSNKDGFHMMNVNPGSKVKVSLFVSESAEISDIVLAAKEPENLSRFTKSAGKLRYPEVIKSPITKGNNDKAFAIDLLTPPFSNPWNARMKLSGIDFLADPNQAVACATDGDVWLIKGLTDGSDSTTWQRIASGLFQPLGVKILDDNIYITCRDQIVLLRDFNGDMETDFYESFNHDHQVTDHFHEFAMGLQADSEGNLYYAKSGRHAREALIPQHGTLLKVSQDGSTTDIVATGFRAANGVCINPDGSFIVTDQQGYWNPMNRINWVEPDGSFYGNMWGYNPPADSSRMGMKPPMLWLDMEYDRSPSELLWIDSEKWGALDGKLISFSYGYGKIQLVLHEEVNGQMQGGVIDLPDIKFLTGVMRGRFNKTDGHLYACGMSAWGTSQLMRGGGLYRLRYTGKPLTIPVKQKTFEDGIELVFASELDKSTVENKANYTVESWELIRSRKYGSDRHNRKILPVEKVLLKPDSKTVKLVLPNIEKVDVLTIDYNITNIENNVMKGSVQSTIHHLNAYK